MWLSHKAPHFDSEASHVQSYRATFENVVRGKIQSRRCLSESIHPIRVISHYIMSDVSGGVNHRNAKPSWSSEVRTCCTINHIGLLHLTKKDVRVMTRAKERIHYEFDKDTGKYWCWGGGNIERRYYKRSVWLSPLGEVVYYLYSVGIRSFIAYNECKNMSFRLMLIWFQYDADMILSGRALLLYIMLRKKQADNLENGRPALSTLGTDSSENEFWIS